MIPPEFEVEYVKADYMGKPLLIPKELATLSVCRLLAKINRAIPGEVVLMTKKDMDELTGVLRDRNTWII